MKRAYFVCLFLCLTTTFLVSQSNPVPPVNQAAGVAPSISSSQADPKAEARILDSYGKLPLSFEANRGQTDGRVRFLARTGGYTLFLTGDEAVLALRSQGASAGKPKIADSARPPQSNIAEPKAGAVLRMMLRNSNPTAKVSGVDELSGESNYFIGNDPKHWQTNVPTYAKVKYEGIYSGIDLVYYGNQEHLEYDFIVAPGANPHRISFEVRGAKRIRRDENGDLVLKMQRGDNEVRWLKPIVYQERDGARREIAANYSITSENRVAFELAKYDHSRPLYIDPLIYSTYLGVSYVWANGDYHSGISVDSEGNVYVTGQTQAVDFPVTPGAFQMACSNPNACIDAFVTKLNPTGSALVYSTYLGGSEFDYGTGIGVAGAGNVYVVGFTSSTDFPVTPGAFQTTNEGYYNAFVTELNASGSALVYSTYLGGNGNGAYGDLGYGIAVDNGGNAYVTGVTGSANFPVTPGAFQTTYGGGAWDTFATEINPTGSALVYSTYLGGNGQEEGYGIAVDSAGSAYVAGQTNSTNFPTTPSAYQTVCTVLCSFVTKFNPSGSALVYSTYLGATGATGIAVDSADNAYITGLAGIDFPVTPGAFQTTLSGPYNAFVTKFNPAGSAVVYSTYLGGSGKYGDQGTSIAVDSAGSAYVTGITYSANFPTTPGAFQLKCNNNCIRNADAFVTRFNVTGSALVYSTYLGGNRGSNESYGITADSLGHAYVIGWTNSAKFPVTANAFQNTCTDCAHDIDVFVTKIPMLAATATTLTSSLNPSTNGEAVTFTAVVTPVPPDREIVSFLKGKTVLGTGTLNGGMATFATSTLKVGTTTVKAVYSGDSIFAGSTSNAVKQVVNP